MKGTIKSSDEIGLIIKTGKRVKTASMIAYISSHRKLSTASRTACCGRVAVVAGKRLGSAPRRNKAKRWIREALRAKTETGHFGGGTDVVLIATEEMFRSGFSGVMKDMEALASMIHRTAESRTCL